MKFEFLRILKKKIIIFFSLSLLLLEWIKKKQRERERRQVAFFFINGIIIELKLKKFRGNIFFYSLNKICKDSTISSELSFIGFLMDLVVEPPSPLKIRKRRRSFKGIF